MRLMKLSGEQASGKTALLREIEHMRSQSFATAFFQQLSLAEPVVRFIQNNDNHPEILVIVDGCTPYVLRELEHMWLPDYVKDRVTLIVAVTEPVRSR